MKRNRNNGIPKGMYQRKSNGIWYYRGPQVDGVRPVAVSLETQDLGEALKELVKRKEELLAGGKPETLGRAVEAFMKYCKRETALRHNSIGHYRWGVNKLLNYFGPKTQLSSITEKLLMQFFSEFKKNHVIDTQHSLRRILRRFYNWAKDPKRRLVKNYPIAAVELGRLGNKSRRSDPFCTKVQRDMLIAQAPDDDMRFVLYMGFHAGLRKLEIMEARRRWFHIGGEERYMEVRKAEGMFLRPGEKPFPIKDSVERDIPISKDFKAFLRHYLKPDLTPLDFVLRPEVKHRKSQYRVDFTKPFSVYMHSQRLAWVTPHTMRRTFASLLVQKGISMSKVAIWLGDDEVLTAKKYAFLVKSDGDIDLDDNEPNAHEILPVVLAQAESVD